MIIFEYGSGISLYSKKTNKWKYIETIDYYSYEYFVFGTSVYLFTSYLIIEIKLNEENGH